MKNIEIIDDFLDEELFKECILFSIENQKKDVFRTNYFSWNKNIVRDSNLVLISDLCNEQLHNKINDVIKTKIGVDTKCIMFYYWMPGSFIPFHNDAHHNGSITIYLNTNWNKNWGGLFLFEEDSIIKAIEPIGNRIIKQSNGLVHSVSCTTKLSDIRRTIQIFF